MPSKFRDNLVAEDEKRVVVTSNIDLCLNVYPYTRFLEFVKKLDQFSQVHPDVVKYRRKVTSSAAECPLDGHGRILIPPHLRTYAGIDKEVLWAGMSDHAELWDIARFEKATEIAPEQIEPLARELAALGL